MERSKRSKQDVKNQPIVDVDVDGFGNPITKPTKTIAKQDTKPAKTKKLAAKKAAPKKAPAKATTKKVAAPKVPAAKPAEAPAEPKVTIGAGRPVTKIAGIFLEDTYGGKFAMASLSKLTQAEFLAKLSDRVSERTGRSKAEARTIYHKSHKRILKTLAEAGIKFADGAVRLPKHVAI